VKITKEELKQVIKEELGSVLEEAKKTPEWSSDYYRGVGRSRAGRGKSAHGHREDPFSSPIRFVKGKLGVPRDKTEKFRRDHNLTTGDKIGDRALSYALYSSGRMNNLKKTQAAIKKDSRRTIRALEQLSSVVDNPSGDLDARNSAQKAFNDEINRIISGERG
jgi:hypothetical protein|tara:strand:+ start:1483 stop:1971 length:489 start_codon:yes stop_codon:yes gene_type:complete